MPRDKNIEDPKDLQRMWEDYKEQITADLIPTLSNKTGEVVYLPTQKPATRWGFEAYVFKKYSFGIKQYIDNQDKAYNAFLGVVTYIKNDWTDDHVTGTMTGKYKAQTLTARVTGVTDNVDVTSNGESLSEIKVNIITSNKE
jgi:hypothetical protein